MSVKIAPEVLQVWPGTQIGVLLAEVQVTTSKKGPPYKYLSDLKQHAVQYLQSIGVNAENYRDQKVCQSWERVFATFNEAGKNSTILNLLRRASQEIPKIEAGRKADLGRISDPVDLYNCVSLETLTPMGALSQRAIQGDIVLRFGREGEKFTTLGREQETFDVKPSHIVYADDKTVLTWLWNHRDASHACVPPATTKPIRILFFADQAEEGAGDVKRAIQELAQRIGNIGGKVIQEYYLNAQTPQVRLEETEKAAT